MRFASSFLLNLALVLLASLALLPMDAVAQQAPRGGTPILVPAQGMVIIEAENFDDGGQDVAYHDNVLGNAGGQYRTDEHVDIITDPAGGFVVNNFDTGEWLEYTVDVQTAGQYEIAVRASSNWTTNTPRFHIEIDNVNVTGSVDAQLTGSWNTFQWNAKGGISLPAGVHVLRLVSDAQYFNVDQIRVTATPTTPFAGVIPIPGTFEAENYDNGGPGISYSDTTPLNDGNQFRTDGVDIIVSRDTLDAGSGYSVNGFHTGEWMVYTVEVQTDGIYDIEVRVATGTFVDAAFHIEIDGVNVTGSMRPGATGDFGTYQWVKKPSVSLSAGRHMLKLVSEQEIADVNRIMVSRVTHTPYSGAPVNGTPIALPGTFEAEHFDEGGEGNAYHDTDATNDGGAQFRLTEGVDIKLSPDSAGGTYVINNFQTGESLVYTVNVAESRDYDIELRAATGATTSARYHIEIDNDVRASVALSATGSFGTYDWIGRQTVHLTAGQHTLKLVSDQQFFDVNQIRVVQSTPQTPPPSLLFRSGYEGNTALATVVDSDCSDNVCRQRITGNDTSTGFNWSNIVAADKALELRPNHTPPTTPGDMGKYIVTQLPDEGRTGRALLTKILQNGSGSTSRSSGTNPQIPYIIWPNTNVTERYISIWVKFQDDLLTRMSVTNDWRLLFEWKTGDDKRRLKLEAMKSSFPQKLYWRVRLDDLTTSPKATPVWTVPDPEPATLNDPAFNIPVPVGQWFKLQVYWQRSGSSLHAWMAINCNVLVNRSGSNDMGTANNIDRIFVHQIYTSTDFPVFQWMDDVQIWSGFPTPLPQPGQSWYDPPYAEQGANCSPN